MIDLFSNYHHDGYAGIHTTDLTAPDLADLLDMDADRLYGMLGPDVVATVEIQQDVDAAAPDEWDMGCAAGIWTGGGNYIERSSVGDVPNALISAIERYRAGDQYAEYWGAQITERAMQRYAGLFGFTFKDASFSYGNDSVDAVIVAKGHPGCTADEIINGIREQWQQYYDGDVYGVASITLNGEELPDASIWGMYGEEYVTEFVVEQLKDAVEDLSAEIKADKRTWANV